MVSDTLHEEAKAFVAAHREHYALPLLAEAISADPKNPELHQDLGHAGLHLHLSGLAIVSYSNAISLENGRDPRSYIGRACALRFLPDFDSAISDYTTAIKLMPSDARNYRFRAHAYLIAREYELAISDCDKALNIDDNDPLTYLVRGKAHIGLGQHEDALEDMEMAFDVKVKPEQALYAWCHWCPY